MSLPVRPGIARAAVAVVHVVEAPLDLRGRVGRPVGTDGRHLAAGQRLHETVGAGLRGSAPCSSRWTVVHDVAEALELTAGMIGARWPGPQLRQHLGARPTAAAARVGAAGRFRGILARLGFRRGLLLRDRVLGRLLTGSLLRVLLWRSLASAAMACASACCVRDAVCTWACWPAGMSARRVESLAIASAPSSDGWPVLPEATPLTAPIARPRWPRRLRVPGRNPAHTVSFQHRPLRRPSRTQSCPNAGSPNCGVTEARARWATPVTEAPRGARAAYDDSMEFWCS